MTHAEHVHLSNRHCVAVCKEMGERLSLALGPQSIELPPAMLALLDELAKVDKRLVQISAYGLAAAVSVSRYTGRNHFLSDVLVGSAIGYGIGRYVYRTHHNASMDDSDNSAGLAHKHSKLWPLVAPRYAPSARVYGAHGGNQYTA